MHRLASIDLCIFWTSASCLIEQNRPWDFFLHCFHKTRIVSIWKRYQLLLNSKNGIILQFPFRTKIHFCMSYANLALKFIFVFLSGKNRAWRLNTKFSAKDLETKMLKHTENGIHALSKFMSTAFLYCQGNTFSSYQ